MDIHKENDHKVVIRKKIGGPGMKWITKDVEEEHEVEGARTFAFKIAGDGDSYTTGSNYSSPTNSPGRKVFQKLIDDTVHVYFMIPGMDKTQIKLRTKPSTMILEAVSHEDYKEVLGEQKIHLNVSLDDEIDTTTVKARYVDGMLIVTAKIANPPTEISIE